MQEIIRAQGARCLTSGEVELSNMTKAVCAAESGEISAINLRKCTNISRIAGSPSDKKAGMFLHVNAGDMIKKGQPVFTIYGENKRKLQLAEKYAKKAEAVELQRIVLETMQ